MWRTRKAHASAEDIDRLAVYSGLQLRMDGRTMHQLDGSHAEDAAEVVARSEQVKIAYRAGELDQQVHVARVARLVARHRAEHRQRADGEPLSQVALVRTEGAENNLPNGDSGARVCLQAPFPKQVQRYSRPLPCAAGRLPPLYQPVLLQDVRRVLLRHDHRRQRDLLLHLLAVQQLDRLPQPLGARRGVEEGRRQLAVVDPAHALVRQRVDAEELDLLLPARVLGRQIGAVGHRVVVAVDEVDLLVVAQRRRHDVVGLVLLPVGRLLLEQVLDSRLLVRELVEAVVAVVRRLGAGIAPDLDHVALRLARPTQQLHRVLARSTPDQHVVAADEAGVAVGVDVAIEHDHRDLGVDRLLDHAGQPRRLLGRHQERVDLLLDEVLDVRHLLLGAVLAVRDQQLHLRVLGRLGLDILVELHPPRLDRRHLREADPPLRGPARRAPARRQDQRGPADGDDARSEQQLTTPHARVSPIGCRPSPSPPRAATAVPAAGVPPRRRRASSIRKSRSCKSTASTMMMPLSRSWTFDVMLLSWRMLPSRPKISTPMNVPARPPLPPMRLVPPIATAAIAFSSSPLPASGLPCRYCATYSTPASAASPPESA